jgi:hypothetical protein
LDINYGDLEMAARRLFPELAAAVEHAEIVLSFFRGTGPPEQTLMLGEARWLGYRTKPFGRVVAERWHLKITGDYVHETSGDGFLALADVQLIGQGGLARATRIQVDCHQETWWVTGVKGSPE